MRIYSQQHVRIRTAVRVVSGLDGGTVILTKRQKMKRNKAEADHAILYKTSIIRIKYQVQSTEEYTATAVLLPVAGRQPATHNTVHSAQQCTVHSDRTFRSIYLQA